jgi:taurine dioxygenase
MLIHPRGKFDNSAAPARHIEVRPLAAAMGAEIPGVDVERITDAQFEEVRAALFRHKMIFFRGQKLSHGGQAAFSLRFGAFAEDAYTKGVPGFPDVQPLVRETDTPREGLVFGGGWHTDSPFLPQPPAISMLYAVDAPPYGGDTIWANSALAYAQLSDTMKALLSPLKVRMSMARVLAAAQAHNAVDDTGIGRLAATRGATELPAEVVRKVTGSAHPLVRTHPSTGEKALYCDETYAIGIEGLTAAEAEPLLAFLVAHITQPAFTCRLRWEAGTLTLWDNRICVHQAFNDYDGFRRELYRTTVAGETPV